MKTSKIIILALALALTSCCGPTPRAYYLYISADSCIYVQDDLGDLITQVGALSEWDDPESIQEVLETQVGWPTPMAASQAYFTLQED